MNISGKMRIPQNCMHYSGTSHPGCLEMPWCWRPRLSGLPVSPVSPQSGEGLHPIQFPSGPGSFTALGLGCCRFSAFPEAAGIWVQIAWCLSPSVNPLPTRSCPPSFYFKEKAARESRSLSWSRAPKAGTQTRDDRDLWPAAGLLPESQPAQVTHSGVCHRLWLNRHKQSADLCLLVADGVGLWK